MRISFETPPGLDVPGIDERRIAGDDARAHNANGSAPYVLEADVLPVHPADRRVEARLADFDRLDRVSTRREPGSAREHGGKTGEGGQEADSGGNWHACSLASPCLAGTSRWFCNRVTRIGETFVMVISRHCRARKE